MDRESSSSELTTAAGSDAPSPRPFALPGHSGDQKVAHILVEFDRQRAAVRTPDADTLIQYRVQARLLCLDIGRTNDFAPFLPLIGHELGEIGG